MISKYNAKDTSVIIDDVYITGFGENMVTWAKDEAFSEPSVGCQGDVINSKINNPLYTMTVTVQKTSPQYGMLIDLMGQEKTFSVWGINKSLGVRFGGENATIVEASEISLGASAEDSEFSIKVFDGVTETL